MDERKAVLVRIDGRVQGVCYRAWTVAEALRLGIGGWVRNRRDGSVEALFAGSPEAVDRMLDACWQGPPAAKVSAVVPTSTDVPETSGFHARATT